jgi:hypothetical protein
MWNVVVLFFIIYDKNGILAEERMFNENLKTIFGYNSTGLFTSNVHSKSEPAKVTA